MLLSLVVMLGGTAFAVAPAATSTESSASPSTPQAPQASTTTPGTPGHVTIGDLIWLDGDKNGRQNFVAGGRERPLEGVTLQVRKVTDGMTVREPVTDVSGLLVGNVTSGPDGLYEFTHLPVLSTGERYEVSIVNEDSVAALSGLTSTVGHNGGTGANDSSTQVSYTANRALKEAGDEDRTLDFGFVPEHVWVGDYVWIDSNRDGRQTDPASSAYADEGLGGVAMRLRRVSADGSEHPVNTVWGDAVGTQLTAQNGSYLFDWLPPLEAGEKYKVYLDKAESSGIDWSSLSETDAGVGHSARDSSTGSAETAQPLLKHNDNDRTLDFGFIRKQVSVGDRVWLDADLDGEQARHPGGALDTVKEPGIAGVQVRLLDQTGQRAKNHEGSPVPDQLSDADGRYRFTGLRPVAGATYYQVVVVDFDEPGKPLLPGAPGTDPLRSFAPTTQGINGGAGEYDSSTGSARTEGALTADGAVDLTLDFGFHRAHVSVGDKVWIDLDRDGTQNEGSAQGVEGVTLRLTGPRGGAVTDVRGRAVQPQVTGADGSYRFDLLPVLAPGESYTVSVDRTSLPRVLDQHVPTREGADSGAGEDDSSTWSAKTVEPLDEHGDRDTTIDFGFVRSAVSVGDTVWIDRDGDGVRQSGEEPLAGVTLVLTGPGGAAVTDVRGRPVAPAVTGADGRYRFDGLPSLASSNHYTVTVDVASSAVLADRSLVVTTVPAADPSAPVTQDRARGLTAEAGALDADGDHDPSLDFGFRPARVNVAGRAVIDGGPSGSAAPDVPLAGLVLGLTAPDGSPVTDVFGDPVAAVTTDADGRFSFENVPTLPAGQAYTVSIDTAASAAALRGLAVARTRFATTTDLSKDGASATGLSVSVQRARVSVGDLVWHDKDRDGRQSDAEPGLSGIEVKLVDAAGRPVVDVFGDRVEPVVTDADGTYLFENLPVLGAGEAYTVEVDRSQSALAHLRPTLPGVGADASRDSSTDTASSGPLTADGDSDRTVDFGFYDPLVDLLPSERPTPTPEPTPTPTPEPSVTPTPTPEPSATPTPTPEPSVTPTPEPTPSAEPDPEPNEPGDVAGDGSGRLPTTGLPLTPWTFALSLLLIAGGFLTLAALRRREA